MKNSIMAVAAGVVSLMAVSLTADAANSVNGIKIDNMGMGNRMVRIGKNGIVLDDAGLCLEGRVSFTVEGSAGQRLFCILHPVRDGYYLKDRKGEVMSAIPFEPSSDAFTGSVPVEIPYSWLGIDLMSNKQTAKDITIEVMIVDPSKDDPLAEKTIVLTGDDIKIDRSQLPNHLLGSLFGGDSVDGDLISKCSACDGTGVCNSCDGDGFIDPSVCRKCANDPGICRRCKGLGKEGTEVDGGGGSLFDLLF